MIRFKEPKTTTSKTVLVMLNVYLDGKKVGIIKAVTGGFQYIPNKQKDGGEVFSSLKDCKESLTEPFKN